MESVESIAKTFLTRWEKDPAGAMLMVAPDIVYTLNVSPDAIQIGGETKGWDVVNEMMLGLRKVFDYLVYRPRIYTVEGDVVRSRVEMVLRHIPSGEIVNVQMRHVLTVREGMVARVDEYVDAAMIETFMRLFSPPAQGEAG